MIIAIQLLVLLLIALSTVLVVGVPVVLASPGQWEQSKGLIYTGAGLWTGLVIVTSLVNSLVV
uniref:Photosystem II reaction center protein Z n=5 Tax=Pyropia TaxID=1094566 RepID=PSBZ_PYRYE|nr:photosystem II protein Z [Pyropia pulchra]YP_010925844.1 photosystem II protein Z [Neoporphyra seriata]YP_536997.1 photosystem II protein Z [Neopyropia yezoensis]Q1XDH1.1 RecName: Full=Photosystem II reaction center protein Z; Short=PSII-Z [Neopyropia yezoensis]AIA21549.1 photosystem II protein Z [Neopyropia fucicola]ALL97264.1 photosystem II protein Z [Pyropia endiviifolia]AGH27643.1 photosystem II protein Z [Neopyropia yezoensis]AMK96869.1 photosystem II protein Z [Pyropia pulchra]QFZ6